MISRVQLVWAADVIDPAKGNPKHDIPVGTQFEDLPDDWRCPRCKRKKEKFSKIEE